MYKPICSTTTSSVQTPKIVAMFFQKYICIYHVSRYNNTIKTDFPIRQEKLLAITRVVLENILFKKIIIQHLLWVPIYYPI